MSTEQNHDTLLYLALRRFIGVLGTGLPIVLPVGTFVLSGADAFQPSISHYYYSIMHVVFVGVLCLLGGFLITYKGTHPWDNWTSNLAGAFAIGVAAFPTTPVGFHPENGQYLLVPSWQSWINMVHYGCALLLFVCFAVFCFKIFQADDNNPKSTEFDDKKKERNKFYRRCGRFIVFAIGSIIVIFVCEFLVGHPIPYTTYSTIAFEAIALWAFGLSWLLKGTYMMENVPSLFRSYRDQVKKSPSQPNL